MTTSKMRAAQGWWRFPGHFLIWAAAPNVASYALYLVGVPDYWLTAVIPVVLTFFVIVVLVQETRQVRGGKHTLEKGLLDFSSKFLGFGVGMLTWTFWWY